MSFRYIIAKNKNVKFIEIVDSELTYEDALVIANALQKNYTLQRLKIGSSKLLMKSRKALREVWINNKVEARNPEIEF